MTDRKVEDLKILFSKEDIEKRTEELRLYSGPVWF